MKRKIRLTESDLKKVIKESVNTILNENYEYGTYVVVDENILGYVVEKGNNNSLRVNVVAVDSFADIHGYSNYSADPLLLNKQILVLNGHYRKATFEDGERFNVNLKNSVNESNNIWNKSNGVVGQNLNVTYEDVRNVYNALYGYENYDGNEEDFENGIEEWWNTILSNARRKNQKYTTLPLNKRQRQIIRKRNNK